MAIKRKYHVILLVALVAGALGLALYNGPLLARYGSPAMRQVVLCDWSNQTTPLSWSQREVTILLLYEDVHDPAAVGEALGVLISHINEDEDEIVRHLVFAAFTAKASDTRRAALSGLLRVSVKNKPIATATFLYYLNHSDPSNPTDALIISLCVSGLAKNACVEVLPKLREFTNSANKYLAQSAKDALVELQAQER